MLVTATLLPPREDGRHQHWQHCRGRRQQRQRRRLWGRRCTCFGIRVVPKEGAVVEEEYGTYNGTHTFSNFPTSGVNFPHFSKCEKCKLTHKDVWESVANCVTVPTSGKVCVEKLNRNLSKKSRDIFSFPTTPCDSHFT